MFSVILLDKQCRIVFVSRVPPPLSYRDVLGQSPWAPHLMAREDGKIWEAAFGRMLATGNPEAFWSRTVAGAWSVELLPVQNLPPIVALATVHLVPVEFSTLTAREIEVARHIVQGRCAKHIASELKIKRSTVDNRRASISKKLGVPTAELSGYIGRHALAFRDLTR